MFFLVKLYAIKNRFKYHRDIVFREIKLVSAFLLVFAFI